MSGMEVIKRPNLEEILPELADKLESAKMTDMAKRQWQLMMSILDFNRVVYSRQNNCLYVQPDGGICYKALDSYYEKILVQQAMLRHSIFLPAHQMKEVVELVKTNAIMVDKPDKKCIMISSNLYWDKERGEIVNAPTAPVFYRLFDTTTETEKIVKVPPFTEEQEKLFLERYDQVRSELERGKEVERYEFLKTWAAGSHDVYMDLHRAHAYMFLKKKPLGSYILIGVRRNGKSTYLNLTHSIMGTNNTSMVPLCKLDDHHLTHKLNGSLMNAPDEEEDEVLKAQALFKSMADHGTVILPVMASNQPVSLECDFMCFFPMNHTPEWKGSGAGACMNRSLIIPFNADLSVFDKTSNNFMKETFTSDVMADYLGSVFAYAWWYHRHNFVFSETMKTEQGVLEQDLDSCLTYYKRFVTYFDGFETFKTVYTDYQLWCQAQDVKINTRKELKFVFRAMCNSKVGYRYKGESKKVYRIPKANYKPMMNDFFCREVGPISELHDKACSLIDRLDVYYEGKGWNEPS